MSAYSGKVGSYGPRRGEAGAVGGVSAIGRRKPSDLATAVLERMARTTSACPEELGRDSWGSKGIASFETEFLARGEDSAGLVI
jgi:hypothetical protein